VAVGAATTGSWVGAGAACTPQPTRAIKMLKNIMVVRILGNILFFLSFDLWIIVVQIDVVEPSKREGGISGW
jgi:hypothetical protein